MATKLRPWDTLTPDQRYGRIKRLSGNPNTRQQIPTRFLPKQYQAARKVSAATRAAPAPHVEPGVARRDVFDYADITKPPSPTSITNTARVLAHHEVDPAVRGYEEQIRSQSIRSKAIQDRATGYFGQVAAEVPGQQAQARQSAETYRTSVAGAGTAAADRLAAALGQNAGAAPGVTSQPLQAAQAAALSAQTQAAGQARDLGQAAATRAQGYEQFANAAPAVVQARQGDAAAILASQLASANQELQGKAAEAKASYGGILAKNIVALHDRAFEEQATGQKLGLGESELAAKVNIAAQTDATKRAVAQAQTEAQMRGQTLTYDAALAGVNQRREAAANRIVVDKAKLALTKQGGGLTPLQIQARLDKRTNFVTNVRNARDTVMGSAKLKEYAKAGDLASFVAGLKVAAPGLTPQQARAAYDLATTKLAGKRQGVSAVTLGSFKGQGWTVPKSWLKTRK